MAASSLSKRFITRIVTLGALLCLGLLIIAAIGLWTSYRQTTASTGHSMDMAAQLMEQTVTRSFESTDVALATLSRRVTALATAGHSVNDGSVLLDPAFRRSVNDLLRFAPHLRQLLITDAEGAVLFDSAHATLDRLDLGELGFSPDGTHAIHGGLQVGLPISGRFLGGQEVSRAPSGLKVLPIILPFEGHPHETLYAIAALNVGFFRELFDAVVATDRAALAQQAFLARYDGTLLVTHSVTALFDDNPKAGHLQPQLLSAITSADWGEIQSPMPLALNHHSEDGLIHWRVSSRYPVAVLLGSSDHAVLVGWLHSQEDILIGVPIVVIILAMLVWSLTGQVLVRTALQNRVRVLSQAIEQGPATVVITDDQGTIEYVNQAFTTTMGHTLDEVRGQTPAVIKSGLMRDDIYHDLWATISAGDIWRGDLLNRTKDGHLCWMNASISAVRDEHDEISHYLAVETDVSERRRLDQQLAEFRQMAEGLLTLPVILYRVNAKGLIVDARGEGLHNLGLLTDGLINRFHNDVFPGLETPVGKALNGEMIRCEGTLTLGGQQIWLDHILAPIPKTATQPNDGLTHAPQATKEAIGIALDVTARHQAEAQLSNTIDRLNASNRELEQFAYVASHDLQEPLRIVSSYLSLLKRRYGNKLGEDADSFIKFAIDGTHRMQSLILDLLQLSRIGAEAEFQNVVNLQAAVNQALENLELAISDSGAVITVDTLPTIIGNKPHMIRLFQNLLSNALKYRHPDRYPIISVKVVQQGAMWHFIVEDNGQGIDEPFRNKVFLIFQRLHTQEQAEGNGIGLAICRKVVERHGGAIWIDGSPEEGTRIHFTLPRATTAALENFSATTAARAGTSSPP